MMPIDTPPLDPFRSRIWAAREMAHERACRCTNFDAGEISHIASGFASRWALKRAATEDQLQAVIRIARRLHLAAAELERLEPVDG